MLMQQQQYELDLAMLAARLNDGRRVLHVGWILLMAMPINEPASTSVWMALPCFTSWVSIAHMRMWAYALRWRRTYQALPSGEMDGEGYYCMKERTMTVETEPLLARISGWWAMFLLFFPNWVLLWWFAVLRASYGFAWLAASKERNKIWILNLFLLVSWMTMSFWFLFFQMWFYFTMMIVEHGLCVIGDGFQILFHSMKERSTSTNMHLNLFLLLVWSVMIDGGAPLWSIFPVWF